METYARIDNTIVVELITTDGNINNEFHPDIVKTLVKVLVASVSLGDVWDGNDFSAPPEDTIDELRIIRLQELESEGLKRMNIVYSGKVFFTPGQVELLVDIEATYSRSRAVAPRLLSVNNILTTYKAAKGTLVNSTDRAFVDSYDIITDPGWA